VTQQLTQRERTALQPERFIAVNKVDLLFPFGERDQRHLVEATLAQRLQCRVELTSATVDDDQVGERLLLADPTIQIATHHLVNRSKVVLLRRTLDPIAAILRLARASGLEGHQRTDRVPPLRG